MTEPHYDCSGCAADFAVYGREFCETCERERELVAARQPLASRIEDALFDDVDGGAATLIDTLDDWCSQSPDETSDDDLRAAAAAYVKALRDQADALEARIAEVLP